MPVTPLKPNQKTPPFTNKPVPPAPPLSTQSSQTNTPDNTLKFPFLLKAQITAIINNAAGVEEKRVLQAVFQLDAAAAAMPWYVLHNYLVPQYLKTQLGPQGQNWKKIYEIKIEKLINRANPASVEGIPLRILTLDQLKAYVLRWEYPIKVDDFHNVEYARQMVALWESDPKGYQAQYATYMSQKASKYPALDNLRKNAGAAISPDLEQEFEKLQSTSPSAGSIPPRKTAGGEVTTLTPDEQAALGTPPTVIPASQNDPFKGI